MRWSALIMLALGASAQTTHVGGGSVAVGPGSIVNAGANLRSIDGGNTRVRVLNVAEQGIVNALLRGTTSGAGSVSFLTRENLANAGIINVDDQWVTTAGGELTLDKINKALQGGQVIDKNVLITGNPGGPRPGGARPAGPPITMAPGRLAPAGVAPGRVAPAGVAPGRVAPAGVAPGGVAPGGVAPGGIPPAGVAWSGGAAAPGGLPSAGVVWGGGAAPGGVLVNPFGVPGVGVPPTAAVPPRGRQQGPGTVQPTLKRDPSERDHWSHGDNFAVPAPAVPAPAVPAPGPSTPPGGWFTPRHDWNNPAAWANWDSEMNQMRDRIMGIGAGAQPVAPQGVGAMRTMIDSTTKASKGSMANSNTNVGSFGGGSSNVQSLTGATEGSRAENRVFGNTVGRGSESWVKGSTLAEKGSFGVSDVGFDTQRGGQTHIKFGTAASKGSFAKDRIRGRTIGTNPGEREWAPAQGWDDKSWTQNWDDQWSSGNWNKWGSGVGAMADSGWGDDVQIDDACWACNYPGDSICSLLPGHTCRRSHSQLIRTYVSEYCCVPH